MTRVELDGGVDLPRRGRRERPFRVRVAIAAIEVGIAQSVRQRVEQRWIEWPAGHDAGRRQRRIGRRSDLAYRERVKGRLGRERDRQGNAVGALGTGYARDRSHARQLEHSCASSPRKRARSSMAPKLPLRGCRAPRFAPVLDKLRLDLDDANRSDECDPIHRASRTSVPAACTTGDMHELALRADPLAARGVSLWATSAYYPSPRARRTVLNTKRAGADRDSAAPIASTRRSWRATASSPASSTLFCWASVATAPSSSLVLTLT